MEYDIKNITIELNKEIIYIKQNNGDVIPVWFKDLTEDELNSIKETISILNKKF